LILGGLVYGIARLVYWRDGRIAEQHERWFANGVEHAAHIIGKTIEAKADQDTAMGRVVVEAVKAMKSGGVFEPVYQSRLPAPGDGPIFEITGLDDEVTWDDGEQLEN